MKYIFALMIFFLAVPLSPQAQQTNVPPEAVDKIIEAAMAANPELQKHYAGIDCRPICGSKYCCVAIQISQAGAASSSAGDVKPQCYFKCGAECAPGACCAGCTFSDATTK